MLFGQLGEHEVLIIVIAFLFLVVGVPTMGAIAAKLGSGMRTRIRRWFSSSRG
jgi:hypothetical protein